MLGKTFLEKMRNDIVIGALDSYHPTTVQALLEHISDLENSSKQWEQSAEVWRKRMEAVADALADVLPGEVGRLDLLARIAELRRQRDDAARLAEQRLAERNATLADLDAELARLKPSGQVAEDVAEANALALFYCRDYCADDGPEEERHTERCCDAREAISRLAAKAQDYEVAVAQCEQWKSMAATNEAEVARRRDEVAGSMGRVAAMEHRLNRVEGERDAAVAGNAGLLEDRELVARALGTFLPEERREWTFLYHLSDPAIWGDRVCATVSDDEADCNCPGTEQGRRVQAALPVLRRLDEPHPGAALLEQHREALAAAERRHETTRATMHVREEQHRKEVETLKAAMTKAAAELRHTYGHVSLGQSCNPDIVSRAIRILEEGGR